ncbi:MAG: hypothetical protein ACI9FN_001414 [Saprospiraceae bacterium]|jgi:hypothetical protein
MDVHIKLWIISLVIGLVVIGVVGFLLHLIKSKAAEIDEAAGHIWTQGKLTANNTIQIPIFLSKTNRVVGEIYKSAVNIIHGSAAIKGHAEGCPGCPHCILENHQS